MPRTDILRIAIGFTALAFVLVALTSCQHVEFPWEKHYQPYGENIWKGL